MRTAVLVALVGLVCVVSAARMGPAPAPAPAPGKFAILRNSGQSIARPLSFRTTSAVANLTRVQARPEC